MTVAATLALGGRSALALIRCAAGWLTFRLGPQDFNRSIKPIESSPGNARSSGFRRQGPPSPTARRRREHEETILITRHGGAIARIVPEEAHRREEIDKAIASIKSLRRRTGKITVAELLEARHAGHRY
jgi:antitoxin (DNA-binding transcriptional repressor) of toxin-antitoxin stability system